MGLLLYKSNEMFSSTELIRKSKTIFNKIIDNEIEKAVIMRDGKPGFLLMDFEKYEAIMAEFEELKDSLEDKIVVKKVITKKDVKSSHVVPPRPKQQDELIEISVEPDIETIEKQIIEEVILNDEPTEEEEIQQALESIKSMNFDDNMKALAEEKIKAKILRAREERVRLKTQVEEANQEDIQEELEMQVHLEEENQKKAQELKEFWD